VLRKTYTAPLQIADAKSGGDFVQNVEKIVLILSKEY
jgi:hypothetical protein